MATELSHQVLAPIYASISVTTLFPQAVGDSCLAVLGERFSGPILDEHRGRRWGRHTPHNHSNMIPPIRGIYQGLACQWHLFG